MPGDSALDEKQDMSVTAQYSRFPPFPPDPRVIIEAEGLLKSRSVRINEVADIILEDPVATLEVLAAANRKFHQNERPAIWSVRTALFRLGTENILLLFDYLLERSTSLTGEIRSEFERLRYRARRISLIARTIADEVVPQLAEECQTAALMSEVGFMLSLARFKERYLKVLSSTPGKGFAYKLEQELKLDVGKFRLDYLAEKWFPLSLLSVFDPDLKCKTTAQANQRFTIEGAIELMEAGESSKLDKYAPEKDLPKKSALRYLEWTPATRESLWESLSQMFELVPEDELDLHPLPSATPPSEPKEETVRSSQKVPLYFVETQVEFIEPEENEAERPITHFSERNQRVLHSLRDMFLNQQDSDQFIRNILSILTVDGPFIRASLLVFDRDAGTANVVLPTGQPFSKMRTVDAIDPLSPVATSNTQIRSFNAEEIVDELAPLGIAAYALSPIRVDSEKQVALYADCGDKGMVPFESRRVFRVAVGLLNRALENNPSRLPQ